MLRQTRARRTTNRRRAADHPPRNRLAGPILAASVATVLCSQALTPRAAARPARDMSNRTAPQMVADQLVDDARSRGRDVSLPLPLANREALLLLRQAVRVNPKSGEAWRLLADSAITAGRNNLARRALLNVVKLMPDNLRAQCRFVDALAQRRQTAQGRRRVYRAAANNKNLSRQVRSALAVKLGDLLDQEGLHGRAKTAYRRAVKWDIANIQAWKRLYHLMLGAPHSRARRFGLLLHILDANPYQTDALLTGGGMLARAHDPVAAAAWYEAAIEQTRALGEAPPEPLYAHMAVQLALAGKTARVRGLMRSLMNTKHPSTRMLLLDLQLHRMGYAGAGRAAPLVAAVRARLTQAVKKQPHNAAMLAAAVWFDLFYARKTPADISRRMTSLAAMLTPNNANYIRLRGWQMLRAKNDEAASAQFRQIKSDPYSRLGRALIAMGTHHRKRAAALLTRLWNTPQSALLELRIAHVLKKGDFKIPATKSDSAMRKAAKRYPSILLHSARDPRDVVLITCDLSHAQYAYGQAIWLNVHYFNATDNTLAVGPGSAVGTDIAMAGRLRGIDVQNLGIFAVDSRPRVYCLNSRSTLTVHYRVDQGTLRELLHAFPSRFISCGLNIITDPRQTQGRMFPGLGGQWVDAGVFEVRGFAGNNSAALVQMAKRLNGLSRQRQLLVGGALIDLLPSLGGGTTSKAAAAMDKGLLSIAAAPGHHLAKAWLLRLAPPRGLPPDLKRALLRLRKSASSLVRMMAYTRILALAKLAGRPGKLNAAAAELRRLAARDKNKQSKAWALALAQEAALPQPKPATTTQASAGKK